MSDLVERVAIAIHQVTMDDPPGTSDAMMHVCRKEARAAIAAVLDDLRADLEHGDHGLVGDVNPYDIGKWLQAKRKELDL